MREVIDDGPDRELALHMKGGPEFAWREQEPVDAPQAPRHDIDEEARAAFAASDAGVALQFPIRRVAAHDLDRVSGIDGFRRIGPAVDDLAIVAMAVELDDRLSCDFDLGHSAAALNFHHSLSSRSLL